MGMSVLWKLDSTVPKPEMVNDIEYVVYSKDQKIDELSTTNFVLVTEDS